MKLDVVLDVEQRPPANRIFYESKPDLLQVEENATFDCGPRSMHL
eukprot:COSAG02_NODE_551_length_20435_cov_27.974380_3_plen_45_part_00